MGVQISTSYAAAFSFPGDLLPEFPLKLKRAPWYILNWPGLVHFGWPPRVNVVVDCADRECIGRNLSQRNDAAEATWALEDALLRRFGTLPSNDDVGITLRTDNALVYASSRYRDLVKEYGYNTGASCWDTRSDRMRSHRPTSLAEASVQRDGAFQPAASGDVARAASVLLLP